MTRKALIQTDYDVVQRLRPWAKRCPLGTGLLILALIVSGCSDQAEQTNRSTVPDRLAARRPSTRPATSRPTNVPSSRPTSQLTTRPTRTLVPKADIRHERSFGDKMLKEPIGIALVSNHLVVSDAGRGRLVLFNQRGDFVRSLVPKVGKFARPMHLFAQGNTVWVPLYLTDRLLRMRLDGSVLNRLTSGFDAPAGIALAADGTVFIADFYHHQLVEISSKGKLKKRWGSGKSGAPFTYPTDVALSRNQSVVYVADAYANRVVALNRRGQQIRSWGGKGKAPGQFNVATGITTCAAGLVYVADFYNHRIQVFDAKGRLKAIFGRKGKGPGQLDRPTDLIVVGNRMHVVDFGNHRIQTFIWK